MSEVEGLRRKNSEYEITITQEWQTRVTRINQENDDLRNQIHRLSQENEELRRRLNDLGEVNRKVAEYENKIALLSQEIERLNGNLRLKIEEYSRMEANLRSVQQENDGLKRRNSEYEVTITREWETKILRYTQELDDYKNRAGRMGQENDDLRNQIHRLSQENEELRRRLNDLGDVNRKVSDYENKITLLSQEIERLNGNLRLKLDENGNLEREYRAAQQELEMMRRKNSEYEVTITREWETKYSRITQENSELRSRIGDLGEVNRKVAEYENKIALLSQELERLNNALRIKVDEISSLEHQNRTLQQ